MAGGRERHRFHLLIGFAPLRGSSASHIVELPIKIMLQERECTCNDQQDLYWACATVRMHGDLKYSRAF